MQKLYGRPIIIEWSSGNGFHAEILEECGIWKNITKSNDGDNLQFCIYWPMQIRYKDQVRYCDKGDLYEIEFNLK